MEKGSVSFLAARFSIIAITIFLVLLSALHILKSEIDPSWRVISEYEIGRFGWIMQIAFLFLAAASLSLFLALKSYLKSIIGRLGLLLLLVTVFGISIGAIFVSDPITTPRDELTTAGYMHNLGGLFSVLVFPFVAAFITLGLVHVKAFKNIRLLLIMLSFITWISLLGHFYTYYSSGEIGPDTLIGLPNRVFIVAYTLWIMIIAWKASTISKK